MENKFASFQSTESFASFASWIFNNSSHNKPVRIANFSRLQPEKENSGFCQGVKRFKSDEDFASLKRLKSHPFLVQLIWGDVR